jgi:hypothetical protein
MLNLRKYKEKYVLPSPREKTSNNQQEDFLQRTRVKILEFVKTSILNRE